MGQEFWVMKNLDLAPYEGTKIFGHNDGDDKRIFVRSNYYYTLYARLWCDHTTEQRTEINSYGIGGFYVPIDYQHGQVQIGTSIDGENWHWTVHNYHTGVTA